MLSESLGLSQELREGNTNGLNSFKGRREKTFLFLDLLIVDKSLNLYLTYTSPVENENRLFLLLKARDGCEASGVNLFKVKVYLAVINSENNLSLYKPCE